MPVGLLQGRSLRVRTNPSDNPRDYADNADARRYDPRLRGPVTPAELAVDPQTGMKNYIANESGFWATSSGYIKHSFARSIHFGRVYTSGAGDTSGREADLSEALRCLGQGLHCVEDFSAHCKRYGQAMRWLEAPELTEASQQTTSNWLCESSDTARSFRIPAPRRSLTSVGNKSFH